jgi:hypothetical protein
MASGSECSTSYQSFGRNYDQAALLPYAGMVTNPMWNHNPGHDGDGNTEAGLTNLGDFDVNAVSEMRCRAKPIISTDLTVLGRNGTAVDPSLTSFESVQLG